MRVRTQRIVSRLTYANIMSTLAVLLVLGGGTAYAANTVFSIDIVDGEVRNPDIATDAVSSGKILTNAVTVTDIRDDAVTSAKVLDRTVNMDDIDGADRSGTISVGAIANGRCVTLNASVSGALPGDVAVLTTNGSIPSGMTVSAQRASTNQVTIKVCNLSGAVSPAISGLPIRVVTLH